MILQKLAHGMLCKRCHSLFKSVCQHLVSRWLLSHHDGDCLGRKKGRAIGRPDQLAHVRSWSKAVSSACRIVEQVTGLSTKTSTLSVLSVDILPLLMRWRSSYWLALRLPSLAIESLSTLSNLLFKLVTTFFLRTNYLMLFSMYSSDYTASLFI